MLEHVKTVFKPLLATWWSKAITVAVLTLLLMYVIRRLNKILHKKLIHTRYIWDDVFVEAIYGPIQWLIGLYAVMGMTYLVSVELNVQIVHASFQTASKFIWLFGLFLFAVRFIARLEARLIKRAKSNRGSGLDQTTVRGICLFSRIIVGFFILLFFLESVGVGLSGLIAFSGASSIAAVFASKDLLANFFGGFMVFYDRPFSVGDWISSPDKNIEGTVEHIGWRLTTIRAFDKRPMYVPNAVFSSIVIVNPQRMTNRRIKVQVGVRYQDQKKIAGITNDIEAMLAEHPDIDQDCTTFVKLVEFGPSSLNLLVYTFTKTTQWVPFQTIQQDVFLNIIDIINAHGAECAFPTTTLDVPDPFDVKAMIKQPKETSE